MRLKAYAPETGGPQRMTTPRPPGEKKRSAMPRSLSDGPRMGSASSAASRPSFGRRDPAADRIPLRLAGFLISQVLDNRGLLTNGRRETA